MTGLLQSYKKIAGKQINLLPASILISVFLILIAWIVEIVANKTIITFSSIIELHSSNPAIWITEIFIHICPGSASNFCRHKNGIQYSITAH